MGTVVVPVQHANVLPEVVLAAPCHREVGKVEAAVSGVERLLIPERYIPLVEHVGDDHLRLGPHRGPGDGVMDPPIFVPPAYRAQRIGHDTELEERRIDPPQPRCLGPMHAKQRRDVLLDQ